MKAEHDATTPMTTQRTTTKTISGHRLTLLAGVRYLASRPFARHRHERFTVTVQPMVGAPNEAVEVRIEDLSYEEANAFLDEFNNGAMSFDGRVW